ncbi:hypothetical protein, partial [Lysinibacillus halotolerans]|uniref:hypothetical protein n=1 Tax=Lysinibacillus halotolerans TaxID=1368476 RepID=UPI0019D4C7B2
LHASPFCFVYWSKQSLTKLGDCVFIFSEFYLYPNKYFRAKKGFNKNEKICATPLETALC